jgi:hypothetical protein
MVEGSLRVCGWMGMDFKKYRALATGGARLRGRTLLSNAWCMPSATYSQMPADASGSGTEADGNLSGRGGVTCGWIAWRWHLAWLPQVQAGALNERQRCVRH